MSHWECRACTTKYSVGAPGCPQCSANDPIDEAEQLRRENEMPKITVHGGPSNADAEPENDAFVDETEASAAEAEAEESVEEPVRPDAHARKAEWVDYAVALGHDRATVESFTKPELVELVDTRETSADAGLAEGTGEASDAS